MTKDKLSAMKQHVNMCAEAYEAGKEAARNPRNAVEIPLKYSNQAQRNAYLDGFAQMREDMADALNGFKMILLPHDPRKGDGVFRKAADCA